MHIPIPGHLFRRTCYFLPYHRKHFSFTTNEHYPDTLSFPTPHATTCMRSFRFLTTETNERKPRLSVHSQIWRFYQYKSPINGLVDSLIYFGTVALVLLYVMPTPLVVIANMVRIMQYDRQQKHPVCYALSAGNWT
ncbi:hypothetical protein P691DRAFT_808982 [Macrolepiota fuliginosa MF-IS2]|uniref:Uncharacterized protein n=1 Tax=Macrolepiota fuliginosa MF-IS2 TaxID=1400762 RepID=A0A9P5X4T7_9AGAR|nr:hypothetical protein P691DRAFT_808982 [Macrolepiota fuliginosa MF-IS2]